MTEPGLSRFMTELQGAYLMKPNPSHNHAWMEALRYIGDADAIAALRDHIRENPHAPKPADIIRMAKNGPHSKVQQLSVDERLRRLNQANVQLVNQRLSSNDETELRFQKFMLYHCAAASLDAHDEDYFRRVVGDEEVDRVLTRPIEWKAKSGENEAAGPTRPSKPQERTQVPPEPTKRRLATDPDTEVPF